MQFSKLQRGRRHWAGGEVWQEVEISVNSFQVFQLQFCNWIFWILRSSFDRNFGHWSYLLPTGHALVQDDVAELPPFEPRPLFSHRVPEGVAAKLSLFFPDPKWHPREDKYYHYCFLRSKRSHDRSDQFDQVKLICSNFSAPLKRTRQLKFVMKSL